MMRFIANLICTEFLYIKKTCINVLLQICWTNVRREYSRDIAELMLNQIFCCLLAVLQ